MFSLVVSGCRRKEDDTNYDPVNMDLSEESQGGESEPELPQAEPRSSRHVSKEDRRSSNDSRDHERARDGCRDRDRDRDRHRDRDRDRDHDRDERRDKRRDSPRRDRDRRSPRRDDRHRAERSDRNREPPRRGLLGDRPDDRRPSVDGKMPALMDLKPFGGEVPPIALKSQDARDAVSPRFVDRDRRDRDRERDRDQDRNRDRDRDRESVRDHDRDRERDRDNRPNRRSEDRRSSGRERGNERSRSRGHAYPPPHTLTNDREKRSPTSGEYRPSSYKVNKKLEVMEKMGLQIKTPDGSMATAQQLRAAAGENSSGLPNYCSGSLHASKILDQVQKRKLLWANKGKPAEEEAAKWSGARFAQDNDGKQVSKFMRLMGIRDPDAVKGPAAEGADPNQKQEELFRAMQAQYEVARAATHTMRGVGLGFQRGQF
ncbi:arginine/serine-rich coiled-coil protein 2-like isoform X2 [Zerene cesonia]|uniref:arginine/serine-rich coiled-coil protein 2-like isoform X2 n=1 Tax=Zerene cesonia TaxID=33412 RepID=UPI0018E5302F|nr:arginine/serine-rich coiled-coil protein 2-like isoform X2 [Zerene cesonia]